MKGPQLIFSIQDSKAEAYMRPFFANARGIAIREFTNLVNDKNHPVGQHPMDYTLFQIGTWDEDDGVLRGDVPQAIANGLDVEIKE